MGASDIPPGPKRSFPKTVYVVVEAAKGSRNVYRYDEDLGVLVLERVLSSTYACPADYGFVPQTLCEDGEKLRCFVLSSQPNAPGAVVPSKPIAVVTALIGSYGKRMLLAVPSEEVDPRFARVESLTDLLEVELREIEEFLERKYGLASGEVLLEEVGDGAAAASFALECHQRYNDIQCSLQEEAESLALR